MPLTDFMLGSMKLAGEFNGLFNVPRPRKEAEKFLVAALDAGFQSIDTAPLYLSGRAEELIGRIIPHDIRIQTKVGVDISGAVPHVDYSLDGMKRSIVGSLKRLQCSSIDTVLVHNPEPSVLRKDAVYEFLQWAPREGLAKHAGISFTNESDIRQLRAGVTLAVACIATQQRETGRRHRRLVPPTRVVLRSIFESGRLLFGQSDIENVIVTQTHKCIRAYQPDAIVYGPKTIKQLRAYRRLLEAP